MTMDKKYIKPELLMVKIQACTLLDGSPNDVKIDNNGGQAPGDFQSKYRDNLLDSSNGMNALW